MTPAERNLLEILDNAVMHSSKEALTKIQELDIQTQLSGLSFCDKFAESKYLEIVNINGLSKHKNHKAESD